MISQLVAVLAILLGGFSFIALIVFLIMFGKLLNLQMRVWLLAKKGYVQVENIGEDKVRRYYYLRPKNNKFDIDSGFYIFFPETITKTTKIMKRIDPKFLVKNPHYYDELFDRLPEKEKANFKKQVEMEKEQYKELYEYVSRLQYSVDATTLRWGIPTVTYYGTNPDPILFSDREKVHDAGVLNDMYLRILLTQKWNMLKKWMIITGIAFCIIAIVMVLIFVTFSKESKQVSACISGMNTTYYAYLQCVNETSFLKGAQVIKNSTIII